jgi:hypothetical protein
MRRLLRLGIFTVKYGIKNAYMKIKSTSLFVLPIEEAIRHSGTSLSDSGEYEPYLQLCHAANTQPKIYKIFRTSKAMHSVVDHVTFEQGDQYLRNILKTNNLTKNLISVVNQVDSIGNPRKFRYKPYGDLSPLSLRYLNTFFNLKSNFGDLNQLNIVEIGGGFGGQAALICSLSTPKSYTLLDLPVVILLQEKFVKDLKIKGDFYFYSNPEMVRDQIDLVLSNYAFSELTKDVQDLYLETVILKSRFGFITWNKLGNKLLDGYSLADLLRVIPNSEILPDIPSFDPFNNIIIWGAK